MSEKLQFEIDFYIVEQDIKILLNILIKIIKPGEEICFFRLKSVGIEHTK